MPKRFPRFLNALNNFGLAGRMDKTIMPESQLGTERSPERLGAPP